MAVLKKYHDKSTLKPAEPFQDLPFQAVIKLSYVHPKKEGRGNMGHILFIDDHDKGPCLYVNDIELEGHRVTTLTEVETCLNFIGAHHPDAVILNLSVKKANGWEILLQIKMRNPDLPIIAISGDDKCLDDSRIFLADEWVIKKFFYFDDLKQKIQKVMKRRSRPRRRVASFPVHQIA